MIHDGDREYKVDVLWQNMYSAPPAVEAADYDGDGDKESISTIQGTGTGVYVEGLYYVDVQKGTPKVSEYTQVVEDFDRRILAAKLDEEFHTLHVDFLDKNGEIDAQESIDLDLTRLLQKMEGYTYKSTGMGAQVRFEFRGGQPFANVWVGINMNEMADLVYETSFLITAPVSMGKDGKFSLGDFWVRTSYSRYLEEENSNKEEPDMTEVYTGYYDLTHNGYKEKVVTKGLSGGRKRGSHGSIAEGRKLGNSRGLRISGERTIWNHPSVVTGVRYCPCREHADLPYAKGRLRLSGGDKPLDGTGDLLL